MSSYSTLKSQVAAVVRTNGENAITGENMQQTLNRIIDSFGGYWLFGGVARPNNNPGTPDQNVAWLAIEPGLYTNYGRVRLNANNIGVIYWDSGHFAIFQDELDFPEPTIDYRGMVDVITGTNKITFTKSGSTWTVTIPTGTSIIVDGMELFGDDMVQDVSASFTPTDSSYGVILYDYTTGSQGLKFQDNLTQMTPKQVQLFTFCFSTKKCSLKTDDYTAP